ncbi:MAG TPA: ribose 5-phosphate isomerase B [Bacteroidia bacterium]|jgi:ribose 5-phosphate isomerase B|nr:ribose 5-phosphate isomerase B [Bacteroidia bacterium]HQF28034.1 ribose 5-phosphate isomerase B [Bacteroidia bacterium]HQK96834.1 ribose 5-phosphate isomerase B [Bacteroidia bacterium]
MSLYIGSDHAGFEMKTALLEYLKKHGYDCEDKGTFSADSVDYPDYAHAVANAVEAHHGSLGILLCGSANGVCIAANKHQQIRAALCWTPEIAQLARQHNDANIVCIPARFVNTATGILILESFLHGTFEGGRHQTRVDKIACN